MNRYGLSLSDLQLPPSLVLPFSHEQIQRVVPVAGGTPFHLYSEKTLRVRAQTLTRAFQKAGFEDYKNFFAVKASPNPHILKVLQEEGMGMDCSDPNEIERSHMVGVRDEDIMYTSNNTSIEDFARAKEAGVIMNLDDFRHIAKLEKVGFPDIVCCRYNPGTLKSTGNTIIGDSVKQKYGMTRRQILEAYRVLKSKGVKRFGLHAMMVSNERKEENLIENARLLFELARELYNDGITLEFINLGGGIGIPYRPTHKEVNLDVLTLGIRREYDKYPALKGVKIVTENGRFVAGPTGALIAQVRQVVRKHANFVGLDASMSSLVRPAIYGAYHHITALGKENLPRTQRYHVTGDLCENNDQFTAGHARQLPSLEEGDLIAIHTTGAHGIAMAGNYNDKVRPAEVLYTLSGPELIRRRETFADLMGTVMPL